MKEPLDEFEEQLFEVLKPDARVSNRVVADELKVTEGAIRHRLRKLTSAKSMRVSALVNPAKVNQTAIVDVRLVVETAAIKRVIDALKEIDQIGYVALVSGASDIVFIMTDESLDDLFTLYESKIIELEGVITGTVHVIRSIHKHVLELTHIMED